MSSQNPLAAPARAQQQQPSNQNSPTSGLAIAGLVLGIFSMSLWLLTAIPGVICSAIAIWRIKRSGGGLQGWGLAITGLVFNILGAILSTPLVPVCTNGLHGASISNMSQIGKACFMYESPSFKGKPPASLEDLFKAGILDDEKDITNPLTKKKDYIFLPYDAKAPGSQIVLLEGPGSFEKSINALYHDGHVKALNIVGLEAQQEFADALRSKDIKAMQRLKEEYQLDFYIPTPNVPENRSSKHP